MRRRPWRTGKGYRRVCLLAALALWAATLSPPAHLASTTGPVTFAAAAVPTPAHVVVVVEENRSQANIIGNRSAPYINQLAANGAMMTQSFAEVHPSEPNYYALFAGSTLGLKDNVCPVNAGDTPNLGSELAAAGRTFVGFAESLPAAGSTVCTAGKYARKHVPWASFTNIAGSQSLPFTAFPSPANFASLPTVAFVIPNLDNDMHDGSIGRGDSWLYQNLSPYANWARTNNSLLILTFDEDDNASQNQIPTVFYGANVRPGSYSETISHYNVLSTLEQMYGLPKLGNASKAPAITDIWAS